MILVAGYTLGTTLSKTFPLELVTVRDAMDTIVHALVRNQAGVVTLGTYGDFGLEGLMPHHLRIDC